MRRALTLLTFLALGPACRAPFPSRADLDAVRGGMAGCPLPLDDDALDDLATYERCVLAPAAAGLVRNDYADDELGVPDFSALRRHDGEVPRSAFQAQLDRFVDPRGALADSLEVDAARGVLRPDPVLAPGVEVAFAPEPASPARETCPAGGCAGRLLPPLHPERPYRPARRAALLAAAAPGRPLAGLRVGIDPGHAGGPYGILEERHLGYRPAPGAPELVLQEGDLTLRTALELRAKLAARGAEVTLTRDAPALGHAEPLRAFRPAAERLLRRIALDPRYVALEQALSPAERPRLRAALAVFAVRKQSRFASLRARARTLAAAQPDLVLSIHYNAAPFPTGRRGPQEVLAMVRGAADAARLYNPYYRWRALEAAFAPGDFAAAAHLGVLCVRAMSDRLALPVAGEPRYPDHLPLRDRAGRAVGVDAWDGALLRYLDVPAVLTEGPYANEREEMERLGAALAAPAGTAGTRTERYADALASCVEAFAARWLGAERDPFGPEL